LEASEFYPSVEALKKNWRNPQQWTPQVWLQSDLLNRPTAIRAASGGAGARLYAVDFEGRQSLCDATFGHFGIYRREIIAERFYSMRLLPAP
jgi:hypothetical protein